MSSVTSDTLSQHVEIVNVKGLHARASAKFAKLCDTFDAHITVAHEGEIANGRHLMDLLLLTAHCGCVVKVSTRGSDAAEALAAGVALIASGFGENDNA